MKRLLLLSSFVLGSCSVGQMTVEPAMTSDLASQHYNSCGQANCELQSIHNHINFY